MSEFLENLNEYQRETINLVRLALFWSSHTDVKIRKDGQDLWFEADWLRHALDALCGPHPEIERRKQEAIRLSAETTTFGPEAMRRQQQS